MIIIIMVIHLVIYVNKMLFDYINNTVNRENFSTLVKNFIF